MSIYAKAIPLILIGVILNAFAQIAMKKAVGAAGMEWSFWPLLKLFLHPWMLTCMGCYALSIVVWASALKWAPASYAFPFMALGFVFVALMSKVMLGETIPVMRWLSISIIVLGVCLQAFTGEEKVKTSKVSKANGESAASYHDSDFNQQRYSPRTSKQEQAEPEDGHSRKHLHRH